MVVLDLFVVALDQPFCSVLRFRAFCFCFVFLMWWLLIYHMVALDLLVVVLDLQQGGS